MTHTKSLASSGRAGILALRTLRFSAGSAQKRGVLRIHSAPAQEVTQWHFKADPVAF